MSVATITNLDPLMTKDQCAAYLGMSRRWIELQVQKGSLPYYRMSGKNGPVRFKRSEVDSWLERRRSNGR